MQAINHPFIVIILDYSLERWCNGGMKLRFFLSLLISVVVPFTTITTASATRLPFNNPHKKVCNRQKEGAADCGAHVVYTSDGAKPLTTTTYSTGYGPADLASAYGLPTPTTGAFTPNGQTVAIVDAYDNPNAASDVLAYRQQFNLPLCATTNPTPTVTDLTGCFFTKVNQSGHTSTMTAGDTGWGQEIDLDLEMVSAA